MRRHIRIKDYVCEQCLQQLKDCKCNSVPWALIMIDEKLQYAIRNLNNKEYLTEACCEGHFEKSQTLYMYISFARGEDYGLPEGWKSSKRGIISYRLKANTKEDFEAQKDKGVEALNKWVDGLEDYREVMKRKREEYEKSRG